MRRGGDDDGAVGAPGRPGCGLAAPGAPPKPDAAAAVARLAGLGVGVRIVTGDDGNVAAVVCREIGPPVTGVMSGAETYGLDDDALVAAELGRPPPTPSFRRC